jgi:alginate O-acetyltransferase complex protein AlgI
MGFKLDENFNYPFICKNITDFWQRWHISLGSFFRDYLLYLPIFGKRRGLLNLFLVWFCTGLWHGASWNFIIWGLYFGVFIFFERMLGKRMNKIPLLILHIYSKIVIIAGFGIFYFRDTGRLLQFLKNIVGLNGNKLTDHLTAVSFTNNIFLILAAVLFAFPVIPYIKKKLGDLEAAGYAQAAVNLCLIGISSVLLINNTDNPFLYFNF